MKAMPTTLPVSAPAPTFNVTPGLSTSGAVAVEVHDVTVAYHK